MPRVRAQQYAVTETLEYPGVGRVNAGSIVDSIPDDSVQALLDSGAIEPFDASKHSEGWHAKRVAAELDRSTVRAGGVPRQEMVDREVRASDRGEGRQS